MLDTILTLIIGLIGGIGVGFQSPIGGAMSQKVGGTSSSFIIHLGGLVFSALLLWSRGGENIREWRTLPWYMLVSGGFGVLLFLTLSHTLPRLGAGAAITLIIVGQLLMGLLIDQFGWLGVPVRPIDPTRVVALLLLLTGGYLMVR